MPGRSKKTKSSGTPDSARRTAASAAHHRIGFFREAFELFVGHCFVVVVFHGHIHIPLAHIVDAVLREVAIDHCDVVPLDIVQIACDQHRDGRFSGSSLLRGKSYIGWLVHTVVNFNCYT